MYRKKLSRNENLWAYIMLAPSLLFFVVFVLIPVVSTFAITSFNWNMLTPPEFAGLENFRSMLQDPRLGPIIGNTLFFTLFSVIFKVGLGLLLALFVHNITKKAVASTFEAVFFFPIMLPMSILAMVWGLLFNTDMGVVNGYLAVIGLPRIPWLTNGTWAMWTIILLDVWKGFGFFFIIYLVALRNIPSEYYEAAEIDGAKGFVKFFRLTFPFLSPTTLFLVINAIIGSLQVFDQAYIMTKGGPGDATTSIVYYIYQTSFQMLNMGYGTVLCLVLFVFIMIITAVQFGFSRKWVFYS